jgi:hypothetical protein
LVRLGRHRASGGYIFFQRMVGSVIMIIGDVIPEQAAQMNVIEDNHVI